MVEKDKFIEVKSVTVKMSLKKKFSHAFILSHTTEPSKKIIIEEGKMFKWYAEGIVNSYAEELGLKFTHLDILCTV